MEVVFTLPLHFIMTKLTSLHQSLQKRCQTNFIRHNFPLSLKLDCVVRYVTNLFCALTILLATIFFFTPRISRNNMGDTSSCIFNCHFILLNDNRLSVSMQLVKGVRRQGLLVLVSFTDSIKINHPGYNIRQNKRKDLDYKRVFFKIFCCT